MYDTWNQYTPVAYTLLFYPWMYLTDLSKASKELNLVSGIPKSSSLYMEILKLKNKNTPKLYTKSDDGKPKLLALEPKQKNIAEIAKEIHKSEGIKGFFSGCIRSASLVICDIYLKNKLAKLMKISQTSKPGNENNETKQIVSKTVKTHLINNITLTLLYPFNVINYRCRVYQPLDSKKMCKYDDLHYFSIYANGPLLSSLRRIQVFIRRILQQAQTGVL